MFKNMNFKISKIFMIILEKVFPSHYLSMVSRLRKSDDINTKPDIIDFKEKVAIVMQGPIVTKDNFTYETLKIYRKRFPKISLILSTWNEYSEDELNKFKAINVEIIRNTKPDYAGISNINFQIESTKNGIFKAKELGFKYCLKTRTDQRIYRHDFILFFLSLLDIFKIENKNLRKRLIIASLNTYKYRLYGVSDMLMFGHIDDMFKYWNVSFDKRVLKDVEMGVSALEYSKACICEVYLCTEFLKKINYCISFTLEDSWSVLANYFCVVDSKSIDLFWFKYARWNEDKRYQNMKRKLDEEFYFSDWVNSVNNLSSYSENQENLIKKK